MTDPNAAARDLAVLQSRLSLRQAAGLARAGRYAQAEQWLQAVLQREQSADLFCLLGKVYAQQARYDEATAAFDRARALDGNHVETLSALDCVSALSRPRPAAALQRWKAVSALVLVILAAFVSTTSRRPPDATGARRDSDALERHEPVERPVTQLMRAFASLTDVVHRLESRAEISLEPRVAAGRVVVTVQGRVPSGYVREELVKQLSEHAMGLDVDATALETTNRYTVRRRDTFISIARALCGSASAFETLQAHNPGVVPTRLHPGQPIAIACQ